MREFLTLSDNDAPPVREEASERAQSVGPPVKRTSLRLWLSGSGAISRTTLRLRETICLRSLFDGETISDGFRQMLYRQTVCETPQRETHYRTGGYSAVTMMKFMYNKNRIQKEARHILHLNVQQALPLALMQRMYPKDAIYQERVGQYPGRISTHHVAWTSKR